MSKDLRNRVIIENVKPEIDDGRHFIKRVVNEWVQVTADIFSDGYDQVRAALYYRHESQTSWTEIFMEHEGNDQYSAAFQTSTKGFYYYRLEAWTDHLKSWLNGFVKKYEVGEDLSSELLFGAGLLRKTAEKHPKTQGTALLEVAVALEKPGTYGEAVEMVLSSAFEILVEAHPLKQFVTHYDKNLRVRIGRDRAVFSAWYELFPRSASENSGIHGSFKDVEKLLPRIQELGFDVLYLPPIHPIGITNRKGKNNSPEASPQDPGSPWAIGNASGGHDAIHPDLGTLKDYQSLLKKAKKLGMELAFDLAFQCAPDHPWVKMYPQWFLWKPDGSISCVENPPQKNQDIVPFNFDTDDRQNLWNALRDTILYWVDHGVEIFRVDAPHTKPFAFWEWVINEVHTRNPDVIFLSGAFTRPKVMAALAKLGFTQSYTYFTWRNNRKEMEDYLKELCETELRNYLRPSFWPNTPDILPYHLQDAGPNMFCLRLLLAATLSSNYGVYGPVYELMENTGNSNGKEEYLHSEKYEIRKHDWSVRNRITDTMMQINRIRKENPALQRTFNLTFTRTDNDMLMSYLKISPDGKNVIWCIANFDIHYTQSGYVEVPKKLLGLENRINLKVTDLLSGETYHWFNDWNFVELNPGKQSMHIFSVSI